MPGAESTPSAEKYSRIAQANLETVRREYGDGGPESKLEYHNVLHTLEVMRNLSQLMERWDKEFPQEKITRKERELLQIAASGHDREQEAYKRLETPKPGDNERLSADDVVLEMRRAGKYSEDDMRFVRACILGTIPEFGPGKLSQPMVETARMFENGQINERQLELAKLLADADLGSLGQGFEKMLAWTMRLYDELKKDPAAYRDFLKDEISILRSHQWVSKVGAFTFTKKLEAIEGIQKILEDRSPL